MSLLGVALNGFAMGVVYTIPPGPAGLVILHHALHQRRRDAAAAVAAFLAAELSALATVLLFFEPVLRVVRLPSARPLAGLFLVGFAAAAARGLGRERGFVATSPLAVFRVTLLNPVVWIGGVSLLTLAATRFHGGLPATLAFVGGMELGSLTFFLAVIRWAPRVPARFRRGIEWGAVVVLALLGVLFAVTPGRA